MTRTSRVLAAVGTSFLLAGLARAGDPQTLLDEKFTAPLDPTRWDQVRIADTKSDRIEAAGNKLVIALDTIGTDDATVKLRGVRSRDSFVVDAAGIRAETTIDWNAQANGCYLSAGLAFVPAEFDGDPSKAQESVIFEWVGVPPGKNVRPYLTRHKKGALIELYTEGWPQPKREDRVGRAPAKSKIGVEVSTSGVRLTDGDKELFKGGEGLPAGKYKLCLFVTGHSNYPERTVYFEGVTVSKLAADAGK